MRPFHLAFPVTDIEATRHFYGTLLGCKIGRESPNAWIDFDLFGHQLSAHLKPRSAALHPDTAVDGDAVPVPHFGVILEMSAFGKLAERLLKEPSIRWKLKPKTRFEGQPGEQATLFILTHRETRWSSRHLPMMRPFSPIEENTGEPRLKRLRALWKGPTKT